MPVNEAKWGIAQDVQQGIEAGQLYLEGGVIRDSKTGRIVQLLREARAEQDTLAECLRPLVPLVLSEALDSRVSRPRPSSGRWLGSSSSSPRRWAG